MNERWFTGFCEGDGSIGIHSPTPRAKLQLGQKDRSPLDYIREYVNGGYFAYARTEDYYYLIFYGEKCVPMLDVLSRYVVSPQFSERLNVVLSMLGMPLSVVHEPTLDWIVGSWDAEGSSSLGAYLGSELYITIYQKKREMLDAIHQFMCCGSVQEYTNRNGEPMHCWAVSGKKALELAHVLLERSHCDEKRRTLGAHVEECLTCRKVREWMKNNPGRVRELAEKGGVSS